MKTKKIILPESQMPTQWYNIVSDMKNRPLPPLNPATKEPVTLEQMSALFAEELMKQEMSTERYIDIPEEVQDLYKIYRSTPLVRAYGLEKALTLQGEGAGVIVGVAVDHEQRRLDLVCEIKG